MDYRAKLGACFRARGQAQAEPALAGVAKEADAAVYKVGLQALDIGTRIVDQMRQELGAQGQLPPDVSVAELPEVLGDEG